MSKSRNKQKELQKEISEMVSVIDDLWILRNIKRFITGMTKDTEYEALVLKKGGVSRHGWRTE